MLGRFGWLNWWPGETPYEIMVGAILTQNTSWTNVERVISNLKNNELLSPHELLACPIDILKELIKPAGFFNQKSVYLINLTRWFIHRFDAEVTNADSVNTDLLRLELLGLKGIGEETADSILLYAFERPIFVIDAYTKRVMHRLGLTSEKVTYKHLQYLFMTSLEHDVDRFKDFHAQFVMIAKEFCRTKPKCQECPLNLICSYYLTPQVRIKL